MLSLCAVQIGMRNAVHFGLRDETPRGRDQPSAISHALETRGGVVGKKRRSYRPADQDAGWGWNANGLVRRWRARTIRYCLGAQRLDIVGCNNRLMRILVPLMRGTAVAPPSRDHASHRL